MSVEEQGHGLLHVLVMNTSRGGSNMNVMTNFRRGTRKCNDNVSHGIAIKHVFLMFSSCLQLVFLRKIIFVFVLKKRWVTKLHKIISISIICPIHLYDGLRWFYRDTFPICKRFSSRIKCNNFESKEQPNKHFRPSKGGTATCL